MMMVVMIMMAMIVTVTVISLAKMNGAIATERCI